MQSVWQQCGPSQTCTTRWRDQPRVSASWRHRLLTLHENIHIMIERYSPTLISLVISLLKTASTQNLLSSIVTSLPKIQYGSVCADYGIKISRCDRTVHYKKIHWFYWSFFDSRKFLFIFVDVASTDTLSNYEVLTTFSCVVDSLVCSDCEYRILRIFSLFAVLTGLELVYITGDYIQHVHSRPNGSVINTNYTGPPADMTNISHSVPSHVT